MSRIVENWLPRHRLTVEEYYRMVEVGLLTADARVELIEGEVIDMPPMGSRHAAVVTQLCELLRDAVGRSAMVRSLLPLRLSRWSEPEPDITLVKYRDDFYKRRHPEGADTLLIVEVSESSLRYDREIKVPLYARFGVPEVWIVDLPGDRVHFFREPRGGGYARTESSAQPAIVAIPSFAGVSVDLSGVLTR